jgi:hypothetical protein
MHIDDEQAHFIILLGVFFGTIGFISAILLLFYSPTTRGAYFSDGKGALMPVWTTLVCISIINYLIALGAALYRFRHHKK